MMKRSKPVTRKLWLVYFCVSSVIEINIVYNRK